VAGDQRVEAVLAVPDAGHLLGREAVGRHGQLGEHGGRRDALGVGLVQQGESPLPGFAPGSEHSTPSA